MKNVAMLLSGLLVFGVYVLPGKVCPDSVERARPGSVEVSDVPACHRSVAGLPLKSEASCDRMVCCLVPDFTRGAVAAVLLPASEFSGAVGLPVSSRSSGSSVSGEFAYFESQAPPGLAGFFSSHASPRGPPLA